MREGRFYLYTGLQKTDNVVDWAKDLWQDDKARPMPQRVPYWNRVQQLVYHYIMHEIVRHLYIFLCFILICLCPFKKVIFSRHFH